MKNFKSKVGKDKEASTGLSTPTYFINSGSYALNKLLSDRFTGGLPQGRLTLLAGHSSSGKSLVAASCAASVIREGGFVLVIDTESALDDGFMSSCGVDTESDNYLRIGIATIDQCTKHMGDFIKDYKKLPTDEAPKALILIDSLDNLMTKSQHDSFEKKSELGGDQGQHAKQIKHMLKPFVHSIANENITIVCTKQVYKEQDPIKAKSEPWVITPSLEYAFSQILTFEKLVFKGKNAEGKDEHKGFTLKARSYKNRFANEKQVLKIEVPFKGGIEPYSGVLDIAVNFGVVEKSGAWYKYDGNNFYEKDFGKYASEVLDEIIKINDLGNDEYKFVELDLDEYQSETDDITSIKENKMQKIKKRAEEKKKAKNESNDEENGED